MVNTCGNGKVVMLHGPQAGGDYSAHVYFPGGKGTDAGGQVEAFMLSSDTAVVVPARPTIEQIRYWRFRAEQRMLIGDSRFITPRSITDLGTSTLPARDLVLPMKPLNQTSADWFTASLFFALLVFATVRQSFPAYLANLFHGLFNLNTASRMFREKNLSQLQGAFRLDILWHVILSVFIFQAFNHFGIYFPLDDWLLFLVILAALFVFFALKQLLYLIIAYITETQGETKEYLFNLFNYNKALGILLVPIVALLAYSPFAGGRYLFMAGFFIVLGFYLLLLRRGMLILLKKQFSIFYLFLYLCTLEFLPLALVMKMAL